MATFWVTSTADSGAGSLRAAVAQANSSAGADVIRFSADFDGGAEDVIRLTSGELDVTDALTIKARAAGVLITGDANGDDVTVGGLTDVAASLAGADRLDDNSRILDAAAALTLDGLTLTGGRAAAGEGGGAVRSSADLTVLNSTLSGNSTTGYGSGGAILNSYGSYPGTTLTLVSSVVSDNIAGGSGGGVDAWRVLATDGDLSDNRAGSSGGAIDARHVSLSGSTVAGNASDHFGGGINGYYTTVIGSVVSGNTAVGRGGGISGGLGVHIVASIVSDNLARGDAVRGGGIEGDEIRIERSVISGNRAEGASSVYGGGVAAGLYLRLSDSTISGNLASGDDVRGGGVAARWTELENATVSGNIAQGAAATGGAVWTLDPGSRLANSIVLGNATLGAGDGAEMSAAGLVLIGGNIVSGDRFEGAVDVGDVVAVGVFSGVTEIAPGVFAGLLGDHGGPTETIAIRRTGPAAGTADPASATATDQRGVARDGAPDLGAFEATAAGLTLAGGAGDDILSGDGAADRLRGREGDDVLRGFGGDDALLGDWGDDRLRGGRGADDLRGGLGDDELRGARGDDVLAGGAGADRFAFGADFGADRILDFDANPAGGQDRIDLTALGITAASFAADVAIRDLGAAVGVTVRGGGAITLEGVAYAASIDRADFLLA